MIAGELAALDFACIACSGTTPGGGGNGEMPTLFLSLAAAAAAADAYFNPSAGRAGTVAGFICELLLLPLLIVARGVCSVARAGSGDFV